MADPIQVPGIDVNALLATYKTAKAAGTVRVINIEGQVYFVQKRFDAATGEPRPVNIPLDPKNLTDVRAALAQQLADMDELISAVGGAQKV